MMFILINYYIKYAPIPTELDFEKNKGKNFQPLVETSLIFMPQYDLVVKIKLL